MKGNFVIFPMIMCDKIHTVQRRSIMVGIYQTPRKTSSEVGTGETTLTLHRKM
jgi:hypothetical protein